MFQKKSAIAAVADRFAAPSSPATGMLKRDYAPVVAKKHGAKKKATLFKKKKHG